MMKHFLIMLIGCGLPILLIFLLPAFGISEGASLAVFLVLMLGCHLMHFKWHSHPEQDHSSRSDHE